MEPRSDAHENEDAIEPVALPFAAQADAAERAQVAANVTASLARRERRLRWIVGVGAGVLVVGVIAVFLALPRWVNRPAPAPVAPEPTSAAAPPAAPALSAAERAQLSAQAEKLLAELLTQQQQLETLSAASWGGADWKAYGVAAAAGDTAYLHKVYREAVDHYGHALALGNALLARSLDVVQQAVRAGQVALVAGNAEVAAQQFKVALSIDPANEAAKAGAVRAQKLPQVLILNQQGDAARAAGDLPAAVKAYQAAVALDPLWKPALTALAAVKATQAGQRYEALMSKGFAGLAAGDYEAAEQQFGAALKARPPSQEARNGLAEARQGRNLDAIKLAHARALAFERRELWSQAVGQYEVALKVDPHLDFAKAGLARARSRAALDAKLENLIDNPRYLFNDNILAGAGQLLAEAKAIEAPGERLNGQIAQLGKLIVAAKTPIAVHLESDGVTEVTLYRVGRLGTFSAKEVALRPGQYTAVGSRAGYRDVRTTFLVLPNQPPKPVRVVCVEQI